MIKDTETTNVVFRKYADGDVIALFPLVINYPNGNCESYQHIGQHGAADYTYVIASTKPAEPLEYEALAKELGGLGYRLKISKRKGK